MSITDSRFFAFGSQDPMGLSFKEKMFSITPEMKSGELSRGIEPSPSMTPQGPDSNVDIYID